MIAVTCHACQRAYNLNDNLAGKRFKCVQCTTVLAVPGPQAATSAPAASPPARAAAPSLPTTAASPPAPAGAASVLIWALLGWNIVLTLAAGVCYWLRT